MISKKIYLLPFFLLFAACTNSDFFPSEDTKEPVATVTNYVTGAAYEQGFVRILLSEELADKVETVVSRGESQTKALAADEVVSQIKIRSMQRTFPYAGRFESRTRKAGLHLWYDVEFDNQTPLDRAQQNLSGIRGVRKVELRPVAAKYDNIAQPFAAMPFNDPRLPNQWNYFNDGSLGDIYLKGADINVFGAWNYTTGTPDVIVAVIDGGIDYTHEDLAANMWINQAELNGTPSVDDDKNGYIDDIYGYNFVANVGKLVPVNHGTHVAGIIAAVNNNGKGICGIAGGNGQSGTGVRLMSCQIFVNDDDPYAGSSGRVNAQAIKYAADNGAVICQNSWGYPTLTETPASDKAAIDYFIEYAGIDENGRQTGPMRGGLVVFAAGNENREDAAPANYEKVVAVASMGYDFRKASYSNFGTWVDLTAPGSNILSTIVGSYGNMSGTSMACPHVSGVAALVLSHFKRSGYNAEMLRARLESSATNIDGYNSSYKGKLGGLVNALAAMSAGSTTPPSSVGPVTGSVSSNIVTLKWKVPADPDDGKASGFNVYYRKTSLTGINVNNPPADVMINSFSTGDFNVDDVYEAKIGGLDFQTTYYFVVNAFDFSGNYSPLSAQVSYTTLPNNPPVINVLDGLNVVIKTSQNAVLRFSGSDPDGHNIFWSLQPSTKGVSLVDLGNGNVQVTITGNESQPGKQSIKLILEDEYGASASQTINFEVLENHPPELVNTIPNLSIGGLNRQNTLSIADYFKDPDGDPLKYTFINTAPNVVNVNENNGTLYIVSLAYGLAQITITATDAMGLSVSQQFSVLIRDESQPVDIYPNPVIDSMWLRTGEDKHCLVTIFNGAGAKVFESEMDISPFAPVKIDMSKYSGGVYSVIVKDGSNEIKKQIIKL